jgi:hypothetical protein
MTQISKSSYIDPYNTAVTTVANGLITWYDGGATVDPLYPTTGYGTASFANRDYYIGNTSAKVTSTSSYSGPTTDDIPDTRVTANTIYNVFVNYANTLSRIRKIHLLKYYNTDGTYSAVYDQTQYASLISAFAVTITETAQNKTGIQSNSIIYSQTLTNFISSIHTAVQTTNDDTLTFKEYYCHSSCHSSCHNSRGRR